MKNDTLKFLRKRFKGRIIRVEDPKQHTTEEIIESYLLLIIWLAPRYIRSGIELADLVEEGIVGLLDAVNRFDPEKATSPKSFHNLAIVRIKHHMFTYMLSNSSMYYVPASMARAMSLVDQARSILSNYVCDGDLEQDLQDFEAPREKDDFPRDARKDLEKVKGKLRDLAQQIGKTYEELISGILKIEHNMEAFGNESSEEREETSEESIADREFLDKFLKGLSSNARNIIRLRLEGCTLEEAGNRMGLCRERARQIEAATLEFFQKTRFYKEALAVKEK